MVKNGSKLREKKPLNTFGSRLKHICRTNDIDQPELAAVFPYSVDTISNWYRGQTLPSDPKNDLPKLIRFLRDVKQIDVSLDYLLCLEDAKTHDAAFVSEYIGLKPEAVALLHSLKKDTQYTQHREMKVDAEHRTGGDPEEAYVVAFDPERLDAERRANDILDLLNSLLSWEKKDSNEELLSLMSVFVHADLRYIAYKGADGRLDEGFPEGEIMATDSDGRVYRIQTTNIIKTQLERPIINGLREISEQVTPSEKKVHHTLPGEKVFDI